MVFSFLMISGTKGGAPNRFAIDPSREGKAHYAGSSALTAAFCVQALARYRDSFGRRRSACGRKGIIPRGGYCLEKDGRACPCEHIAFTGKFKGICGSADRRYYRLKKLRWFRTLCARRRGSAVPSRKPPPWIGLLLQIIMAGSRIRSMTTSSTKKGDPLSLSAANFFLRQLTAEYIALDKQIPGLAAYYKKIMDAIDAANLWELQHCRVSIKNGTFAIPPELPFLSLDALADRSLGHALPAVGVLLAMGYAPDSAEIKTLISFFRNYLIARQLHDDATIGARICYAGRSTPPAQSYCASGESAKTLPPIAPLMSPMPCRTSENCSGMR